MLHAVRMPFTGRIVIAIAAVIYVVGGPCVIGLGAATQETVEWLQWRDAGTE